MQIDIKPGSSVNRVTLARRENLVVAILGSCAFDVEDVDPGALAFGPLGATPTGPNATGRVEDVNGDGFPDLASQYRSAETGIQRGDEEACLRGRTLDGEAFEACDSVLVQKGKKKSKKTKQKGE